MFLLPFSNLPEGFLNLGGAMLFCYTETNR